MKSILHRAFMALLALGMAASLRAVTTNDLTAPVPPGVAPSSLSSTEVVYLYNVEADAFLGYGMNWNTNAIATRLSNGDQAASTRNKCYVSMTNGTLLIRNEGNSTAYVGTNGGVNDVWVDFTTNHQWTVEAAGSTTYRILMSTHALDVSYPYGGHLTTVSGQGYTEWAFIPEGSITNGAYVLYKAKRKLYDIYQAVLDAEAEDTYPAAMATARNAYNSTSATAATVTNAAKTLLKAVGKSLTHSVDATCLFTNADILGTKGLTSWTSTTMDLSYADYEVYHKTCTLSQTQTGLPAGLYSVKCHSLVRLDGSSAVPDLKVVGSTTRTAPLPNMAELNWGCNVRGDNGWREKNGVAIPDNMLSAGQGMTHGDAVAQVAYVPVDGSMTISVSQTHTDQWFNMQGFEILYTPLSAMTELIANPTFIATSTADIPSGWQGETSSWRWTQGVGDNVMECWNGTAKAVNFNMYQTISHLPAGVYELSAYMFNSTNGSGETFCGGECGLYASTASANAFVGITTDSETLTKHSVLIHVNEGETLTIGVKNVYEPSARWFVCDNFALKLRTLESATDELVASIPTAPANAELRRVMDEAKVALLDDATAAHFNALTSAIADVRRSAAVYTHVAHELSITPARYSNVSSAVKSEYTRLHQSYQDMYDHQTIEGDGKSEIAAIRSALAQAVINCGTDLTVLIANNSFETGNTNGWTVKSGDDTGVRANSNATYTTSGCDGNYLFNTWSSGYVGGYPVTQNIAYLPAGTYRLTALVASNAGAVYLTLNGLPNHGTATTDKTRFLTSELLFSLDEATEVTIGAVGGNSDGTFNSSGSVWYKADNFRLSVASADDIDTSDIAFDTNSYFARGSEDIFGRFSVTGGNAVIRETGLCYSSENELPTIADGVSTDHLDYCGKIYKISGLTPSTAYYVRPYAKVSNSIVRYGAAHKVCTIPRGQVSYGIRPSENATYDANIRSAVSTCVDYWNRYTSIAGLYINAGYVSGVATADCSYGGYQRYGSNTSYQQCGTVMHESLHAIGMGTHSVWSNLYTGTDNDHVWVGPRVTEFLRFWENSESAVLRCDSQHSWCSNGNGGLSYTINGAQEDAYSDLQRTANALLAQSLCEDGLQPTSTAYFTTPYYSLEQNDHDIFYIQGAQTGSYLVDDNGTLTIKPYASIDEAQAEGIGGWQLQFDPATRWYTLTNTKTGNRLSHENYVWGLNKADSHINLVESVNQGYHWLTTPTQQGRHLQNDLTCGYTQLNPSTDTAQDWRFVKTEQHYPQGDINQDGRADISDVTALVNIILGKDTATPASRADINKDGHADISDVTALVNIILGK